MYLYEDKASLASVTTRHLAPAVKQRLRVHAAQPDHSIEVEARAILQSVLDRRQRRATLTSIRCELFGPENGVERQPSQREPGRIPPSFEGQL